MLQPDWLRLHDKCPCVEGIQTRSWWPWLSPASLPSAAGGRLGRPGGDDLAVDGAEEQHEPDGAKHLGGWDAMVVVDGRVEERRCHCGRAGGNSSVRLFTLAAGIEPLMKAGIHAEDAEHDF